MLRFLILRTRVEKSAIFLYGCKPIHTHYIYMMDKFNDDCGIVQLEIRGMALAETQYLP
jgi:hypothetical protein